MRNMGEMRNKIKLFVRDPEKGNAYTKLCEVYAARRDVSGKEFMGGAAVQQESTVIFTIHRPRTFVPDSGLRVEDMRGNCYEVVYVVDNPVFRTCVDLRAITTRMEGVGYV